MAETVVSELRFELGKLRQDAKKATDIAKGLGKDIANAVNDASKAASDAKSSIASMGQNLNSVSQQAKNNARITSGMTSAWRDFKSVIAALGLVSLANQIRQVGTATIQNAESLTSFRTQINALTGDIQKTSQIYEFVKQTSDRLAISTLDGAKAFAQMANSAKNTVAEGQGVKTIFESLLTAGSALRLNQDQMRRIFLQVNQGIARQKFETEDLSSIVEAGIPVYRMFQEILGVTGEEFRKMLEKGEIGLNELILLSQQINKEYSAIAEEAANTVPARFRRMFNQIKTAAAEIFEEAFLLDDVKEATKEIEGAFNDLKQFFTREDIKSVIAAVASEIRNSTEDFRMLLNILIRIKEIIDGIRDIPFIKSIREGIEETDKALDGFLDKFPKLKSFLESTGSSLRGVFGGAGVPIVGPLQKLLPELSKLTERQKEVLKEFGEGIEDLYGNTIPTQAALGAKKAADASAAEAAKARKRERDEEEKKWKEREKDAIEAVKEIRRVLEEEEEKKRQKELQKEAEKYLQIRKEAFEAAQKIEEDKRRIAEREAKRDVREQVRRVKEAERELNRLMSINELKKQIETEEFLLPFRQLREEIEFTLSGVLVDLFVGEKDGVLDAIKEMKDGVVSIAKDMANQFLIEPLFQRGAKALLGDFFETGEVGGAVGGLFEKFAGFLGPGGIEQFKGISQGIAGGFAGGRIGATIADIGGLNKGQSEALAAGTGLVSGAFAGGSTGNVYAAVAGALVGMATGILSAQANKVKTQIAELITGDIPRDLLLENNEIFKTTIGNIALVDAGTKTQFESLIFTSISEFDKGVTDILSERLNQQVALGLDAINTAQKGRSADITQLQAELLQERAFDILSVLSGSDVASNVVGARGTGNKANIQIIQKRFQDALEIIQIIEDISLNIDTEAGKRIKDISDQFGNLIRNANVIGIPVDKLQGEMRRLLDEIPNELNKAAELELLQIKDSAEARRVELRRAQSEELKEFQAAGADLGLLAELHRLELQELEKELEKLPGATEDAAQGISELNAALSRAQSFINQGLTSFDQQVMSLRSQSRDLLRELTESGADPSIIKDVQTSTNLQMIEIFRTARDSFKSEFLSLFDFLAAELSRINSRAIELQHLVDSFVLRQSDVDRFLEISRAVANMSEATRLLQGNRSEVEQLGSAIESFFAFGEEISPVVSEIEALVDTFANLRAASIQAGLSITGFQQQFEDSLELLTQKEMDRIDQLLSPRQQRLSLIDDFIAGQALGEERPLANRLSTLENRFFDAINKADIEGAVELGSELRELSKQQFGSTAGFFQLEDRINTALMGIRAEELASINEDRQIMIDQFNAQVQMVSRLDSSVQILESLLLQGSTNASHTRLLIELSQNQNRLTNSVQSTLENLLREVIP